MNLPRFLARLFSRPDPQTPIRAKLRARYFGLRDRRICGAVDCPDLPDERFHVALLADPEDPENSPIIATTLADREAWSGGGIEAGYGFDFDFPSAWQDGQPKLVRFRIVETGRIFPQSEKWVTMNPSPRQKAEAILSELPDQPHQLHLVLVTHELHRTGAPIILLNLLRQFAEVPGIHRTLVSCEPEGDLEDDFSQYADQILKPAGDSERDRREFTRAVEGLLSGSRAKLPTVGLVNSLCSNSLLAAFDAAKVPFLWLIHEFPQAFPQAVIQQMRELPEHLIFPCATVQEAFLERLREDNQTLESIRAFRAKSEIFPQGVTWSDEKAASPSGPPQRDAIRQALEISPETFLVLIVGTVDHRKGADWMVAFSRWFASQHPKLSLRFAWVGKATSSDYYRDLERDNALGDNRHILQFVGECTDVSPYYEAADLLLVPSRLDPFPNVVLEAMKQGLPFVGFDHGQGTSELLVQHDVGTQVGYQSFEETARALVRYAEDDALRARQSEEAIRVAASFTHEAYFRKVMATLVTLLPEDHPARMGFEPPSASEAALDSDPIKRPTETEPDTDDLSLPR